MFKNLTRSLVVLLLVVVTACDSETSPQPTTLEIWAMGKEGEALKKMALNYELLHPDIHIKVQQIPWSAAHEKLLTAYVGGTLPDIFQLGNTWIPEFVTLQAITPLENFLKGSNRIHLEDYFEKILETNRIKNQLYALPWYIDTRVLFYRKDLLVQAGYLELPKNWPEWLLAMQQITASQSGTQFGILLPINDWFQLVILAMQWQAPLLTDNDQHADFHNPKFVQAFRFYLDFFEQKLAPTASDAQIANLYQEFTNGYFAVYMSGPWNIEEFSKRLPVDMQDKWSTAPLPSFDNNWPGPSLAGGASLAIANSSQHKKDAWELLTYLSSTRQQIEFHQLTANLPALKSAWTQANLSVGRYTQAFWVQLTNVKSTPRIPEWEQIASLIARYAEQVIRKSMDLDTALAALDKDVNQVLEKRRWLIKQGLE